MRLKTTLVLCLLVVCMAQPAWAHRVNIFAWIENDQVTVECRFSKSSPVRSGAVIVYDAATKAELLHGNTDEQGIFTFPVPQQAREAGHGLYLVLKAGEGHQNDWTIDAAELAATKPTPPQAGSPAPAQGADQAAQTTTQNTSPAVQSSASPEATAQKANTHVRTRAEAEAAAADPGLREIALGIAIIFALAGGIALIRRSRV